MDKGRCGSGRVYTSLHGCCCMRKEARPCVGDASRSSLWARHATTVGSPYTGREAASPPAQDRDHRAIYGPPGDRRSAPLQRRSAVSNRRSVRTKTQIWSQGSRDSCGIRSAWKTLLCVVTGSGGLAVNGVSGGI